MEGSGIGDFANQIIGLLIITVVAGMMWVVLTVLIMRRAAERRRRKREGLENLPSFYSQGLRWIRAQLQEQGVLPATMQPTWKDASKAPLPDFDALVSPVPTPDLDSLLGEIPDLEVESVPHPPSAPPPPEPIVSKAIELPPPAVMQVREALITLPVDAVEMMRIWRDLDSNSLIVEMRGQYFVNAEGLTQASLMGRYTSLIEEMQKLGGSAPVEAEAPKAAKPKRGAKTETVPEEPPDSHMSIPEQIEELLQRKLLRRPEFADNDIHVRPGTGGGVLIEVDGQFYDAISDVEDEAIRSFIQDTILEWEKRS